MTGQRSVLRPARAIEVAEAPPGTGRVFQKGSALAITLRFEIKFPNISLSCFLLISLLCFSIISLLGLTLNSLLRKAFSFSNNYSFCEVIVCELLQHQCSKMVAKKVETEG